MMELIHYTKEPFFFDPARRYEPREGRRRYFKPVGLWVSVKGEADWRSWCEGEQWGLDGLRYESRIRLARDANILRVRSVAELDEFTHRYWNKGDERVEFDCYAIDWPKVAEEHDGIIIAPYQWNRRCELMWYYSWDCASGCIWNLRAIKAVEPLIPSLSTNSSEPK